MDGTSSKKGLRTRAAGKITIERPLLDDAKWYMLYGKLLEQSTNST